MKKSVYYHTLTIAFLFSGLDVFAQKSYDTSTSPTQVTLEGKTLPGYKTNFDFSREEVRRGWWEYARSFGTPLNMKSYYKVTVPAETTDGNVDLLIFTQATDGSSGCEFFLGLELEKYREQARGMLLDFKKDFYIKDLLQQIKGKEREANKMVDAYRKEILESKKNEYLNSLIILGESIDSLKETIKSIEGK